MPTRLDDLNAAYDHLIEALVIGPDPDGTVSYTIDGETYTREFRGLAALLKVLADEIFREQNRIPSRRDRALRQRWSWKVSHPPNAILLPPVVKPATGTLHRFISPGVYQPQTVDAADRSSIAGRQQADGEYVVPVRE